MSPRLRIVASFRRELSDWRLWLAPGVVIAVAAAAGLTVVAFTWMTEHALDAFRTLRTHGRWAPLIVTPALTAAIVWATRRFAPGAAGSGIPQVMAALDPASRWRARRTVLFAAACGLGVAVIGAATGGVIFGSGHTPTRQMLEGGETVPALHLVMKFIATWLTAWSGVPGGIFAPALIALGMAAFLAAATQAPLTAFIIVMEMVDGHAMVLSLMACALVASGLSRMISRPLYGTLARAQLQRLPPPPEAAAQAVREAPSPDRP